ncbi:hypothetical protein D6T63_03430 [Arthrobacter cheniae]|uniref:Uncharacterized protein n=2 Tax=Arthrobacter cheniae TaxID=1258888 RepID=A0A3A5MGR3_9MICC|nr:hypothetical protein D6T63_03430 [Arthrobacter cheniae]
MGRFGMKTACTFLALLGLTVTGMAPVAAAPASGTTDLVGNDVSWPQCGKTLPSSTAFAIVGVNGGLANNTNPCLSAQLAWAEGATETSGVTAQPKVALYVNTANPGHAGSWWPSSNIIDDGKVITNPYGACAPAEVGQPAPVNRACSYMYGYVRAYQDATSRGVANPGPYFWWLDVETGNSWQTGTSSNPNLDGPSLNRANLEGMVAYFESITDSRVGIYSTGYQWGTIAGTVPSSSSLMGLPSWLAGSRTLRGAKSSCSLPGLTPGSRVSVTQYVSAGLDYNYSCP